MRRFYLFLLMIVSVFPFQAPVYAEEVNGAVLEISQTEPSQFEVIELIPAPEPELTVTGYVEPEPIELKVEEKIPALDPEFTATPLEQDLPPIVVNEPSISLPTPTFTPIPIDPPDYPPFGPVPIEINYPPYGPIPINPPNLAPSESVPIEPPVSSPFSNSQISNFQRIRAEIRNTFILNNFSSNLLFRPLGFWRSFLSVPN